MIRRADAVEVEVADDAIDAVENDAELYSDVLDRLERTEGDRWRVESVIWESMVPLREADATLWVSRADGGTSWSWRFRGWFDIDGGGRTTMNVS